MIDWDKSAELNKCSISEIMSYFKKYPQSEKIIIRVCDGCEIEKKLRFCDYHDLCKKCTHNLPETREANSQRRVQYYIDNPGKCGEMSEIIKQYFIDNPNAGDEQSDRLIQWYKNNDWGEDRSLKIKQYFIDNPNAGSDHSQKLKQFYINNPDFSKEQSDRMRQYFIDYPEARERASASQQGQDYDAGEWTGFTDNERPYVVPTIQCIQMNDWFVGCHGHHITKSIIAFIPADLHRHIRHNLRTGSNMGEMNALAIQFINGGLEV